MVFNEDISDITVGAIKEDSSIVNRNGIDPKTDEDKKSLILVTTEELTREILRYDTVIRDRFCKILIGLNIGEETNKIKETAIKHKTETEMIDSIIEFFIDLENFELKKQIFANFFYGMLTEDQSVKLFETYKDQPELLNSVIESIIYLIYDTQSPETIVKFYETIIQVSELLENQFDILDKIMSAIVTGAYWTESPEATIELCETTVELSKIYKDQLGRLSEFIKEMEDIANTFEGLDKLVTKCDNLIKKAKEDSV